MGLDRVDTPVRITWDFPDTAAGDDGPDLPAIAKAIVDAGVFFVTLQGRPLQHPDFEQVSEVLNGFCQLLVYCRGAEAELAGLSMLPANGQVILDVQDFLLVDEGIDRARLQKALEIVHKLGHSPALSLTPLRSNLLKIPELLKFCREHNVPKFKLPNAHIGDSFQHYSVDDLPRWQDLESFASAWREFECDKPLLPELEIHDLFLWEIMTPGQAKARSEYAGCQAGNSLGHVDLEGVVHPCAAWPQPLGRLPDQSLFELWTGEARHAVLDEIARTPDGCSGCSALASCFGGCRGLGKHLNKHAGARDLMCKGPR